ncbi:MAG TPA: NAD(P)/FAD-dependent oxidoreductase [Thermoanaerobaculaceae bacterium]|nr:NAD(P)/FAD-dependent oxidoreductase [Thermoanaerobaculaceae bacterium]
MESETQAERRPDASPTVPGEQAADPWRDGRPHLVIVGGGFAGLYAARTLKNVPLQITVVDRRNHHVFQPLLYQVATAALSPGDIAYPIRSVLAHQANTRVWMAEVVRVDLAGRRVVLSDGELAYDYLILAAGARHSYFGHDEWEGAAPGLKSLDDAFEIRRRIMSAFERAEREPDDERRRELMTFVVVGGGPTGVELAGAIAEIACQAMGRDFRSIDPCQAHVLLIEAGPRVLPAFPQDLSAKAEKSLARLGVEVWTSTPVTSIERGRVWAGTREVKASSVFWAAGVAASPLARTLGVQLDRAGRVVVRPDLTIPGHPEAFVVGDLAAAFDKNGKQLPGLAPVAIQQGRHVARNVVHALRGEPPEPFRYKDRGMLATIGRAAAVADLGKLSFSGYPAWLAWIFIHIFWLIGFRNRFLVLFEWAWAYVTYQRAVRLITGEPAPD